MITTLDKTAKEGGTYTVQILFRDEDKNSVVPNEITYTLSDKLGNVINSIENISITPASTLNITLTGASLTPGWKILTIKGTYDSSYGVNLPLRDSVKFYVDDLIKEG